MTGLCETILPGGSPPESSTTSNVFDTGGLDVLEPALLGDCSFQGQLWRKPDQRLSQRRRFPGLVVHDRERTIAPPLDPVRARGQAEGLSARVELDRSADLGEDLFDLGASFKFRCR